MKPLLYSLLLISLLTGCNPHKKTIVSVNFIDSLITKYSSPATIQSNAAEIQFWKNRIDPANPGIVNESKYAAALVMRFHLSGDLHDLIMADSLLKGIDSVFNHKEASPILALTRLSILQHHFKEAAVYLMQAQKAGVKPYDSYATAFDVDFELGQYDLAASDLKSIAATNDYGYYFRRSRLAHYNGDLDSSIAAMQKAIDLSATAPYLMHAAMSNTADLYLHAGRLQEANDLYMASIRSDASDLHSIMGLGWIALINDQNDSLAEKIFQFVQTKTQSPDPLYKLILVAEARDDSALGIKYATKFATMVSDPAYGNMYNKYLVDLYTGILNDPAKAESIAKKELDNRSTPQTYAWYTWTLYNNNKKEEAFKIYQQYVSGKPLEALELYWMGKLMQGSGKGYNAGKYFEAAYKNKYDLSPAKMKEIEKLSGEK